VEISNKISYQDEIDPEVLEDNDYEEGDIINLIKDNKDEAKLEIYLERSDIDDISEHYEEPDQIKIEDDQPAEDIKNEYDEIVEGF